MRMNAGSLALLVISCDAPVAIMAGPDRDVLAAIMSVLPWAAGKAGEQEGQRLDVWTGQCICA